MSRSRDAYVGALIDGAGVVVGMLDDGTPVRRGDVARGTLADGRSLPERCPHCGGRVFVEPVVDEADPDRFDATCLLCGRSPLRAALEARALEHVRAESEALPGRVKRRQSPTGYFPSSGRRDPLGRYRAAR